MRAIAFAIIYAASEIALTSMGQRTVAFLVINGAINLIALGGFVVCIILGA